MMEPKHLVALERWTLAFAALVVGFALLALGGRTALGVTVGAALMSLNAWSLRKIGARAFKSAGEPSGARRGASDEAVPRRMPVVGKPGLAVLLFNLKMFVLVALVFVILRYLPL